MQQTVLVWFRQDLRVSDQPVLSHALTSGRPVIAIYLLDDATPGQWAMGAASRWWLHNSLAALRSALKKLNIPLVFASGEARKKIPELVRTLEAGSIFWTRQYEPYAIARDTFLKERLKADGIEALSFNGQLLFEPMTITKPDGGPYAVFSAFWKACRAAPEPAAPAAVPSPCAKPAYAPAGEALDAWNLLPQKPDWAGGLCESWTPGELGAQALLNDFLDDGLARYAQGRDFPAANAVSRLSPHLHFGEISPRMLWHAVQTRAHTKPHLASHAEKFLSELGWREFAHHLLYHNPKMPEEPLRASFSAFPWDRNEKHFHAWTKGLTGYPIVDAGMRELWQTGIIHNRVRMIVGSFLVKDLLIPWQRGEAWFWDTLVDADLANNAMGWQWIAGCGADAAPYFRIFNPVLQGEKFDPDGDYVRRFVPELAKLPNALIHKPFEASDADLKKAGIRLGVDYPRPVVDHGKARERALQALASLRDNSTPAVQTKKAKSRRS